MKITINGNTFGFVCDDSKVCRDIESMLPLTLNMRNNGDVEYVGQLPEKPVNEGLHVSETLENCIYYYEGWNVFCLNYRASDISPYTITYLGKCEDPSFTELLIHEGKEITAVIESEKGEQA